MKILVVDAHPDDSNISAGGTLAKLRRKYKNCIIWSIYFAPCTEDPKNEGHLKDHRDVCCNILGMNRLIEHNFPRDLLETHKQEIRNILFKLREEFKPDIVFCPSPHEFHQDHKAIAECCQTIFRDTSTILGYEVLRSVTPDFRPTLFVTLTANDAAGKVQVISGYKSQMKGRPYFFSNEAFMSHLRMRGTQAKTEFAEAFEVLWGRWD